MVLCVLLFKWAWCFLVILSFISFIIALVTFIFLIFLCFKHEKLRRFMSFYVASLQTVAASLDNTTCNRGDVFLYLLSAVCCCSFMWCSNYSSTATDTSVDIIQPHIFFAHMVSIKDLRLLLPSTSVLCRKSSMSTLPIYTYQSYYCQSMKPTTTNITSFQVIGFIILLKSLSQLFFSTEMESYEYTRLSLLRSASFNVSN